MGAFRKLGQVIFFLATFLTFAAACLLVWVRLCLLSPDHAAEVLANYDAYLQIRETLIESELDPRLASLGLRPEERGLIQEVVQEVLPPHEVQLRVEEFLAEALPYLARQSDTMEIRPELWVIVLDAADLTEELELASFGIDSVIIPRLLQALRVVEQTPLAVHISDEEVRASVRTVIDEAWLEGEIAGASAALAYYLVGRTNQFEVHVDYRARLSAAQAAVRTILARADLRALFADLIVPLALSGLRENQAVLPGQELPSEEALRSAIIETFPEEDANRLANSLLRAVSGYLAGERNTLSYDAELGPFRERAADLSARLLAPDRVGAGDAVRALVLSGFPERMTFDETQIQGAIGEEAFRRLRDARAVITQGFQYTDEDLRRDAQDAWDVDEEQLTALRFVLSADYVYTERDFEVGQLGVTGQAEVSRMRAVLGWAWPLVALAFTSFIGVFLFSRGTKRTRIAWGLVPLGLGATTAALASGPITRSVIVTWGPLLTHPFRGMVAEVVDSALVTAYLTMGSLGGVLLVVSLFFFVAGRRTTLEDDSPA